MAYVLGGGLWLRPVDQLQSTSLVGTGEGAENPFFSPDSQWIGYHSSGQLRRISIAGGAPVTLADV